MVPPTRFHVQPVDDASVLGFLRRVLVQVVSEDVVEGHPVDGVLVLSREVLQRTGEERLREEEA
eukprot:2416043-Rhodomonas_salina.1